MHIAEPQRLNDPSHSPLTPGEHDVLRLMADGLSNQGIATHLALSPKTIEGRIAVLYAKLGVFDEPSANRRVIAVLRYLTSEARISWNGELAARKESPTVASAPLLRPQACIPVREMHEPLKGSNANGSRDSGKPQPDETGGRVHRGAAARAPGAIRNPRLDAAP